MSPSARMTAASGIERQLATWPSCARSPLTSWGGTEHPGSACGPVASRPPGTMITCSLSWLADFMRRPCAHSLNDVQRMRRKPDGGKRVVLSYMSIGEAEDYRYYWDPTWKARAPAWLEKENPDWPGNYKVRYWSPEWRALIFGSPGAYLDKIIAAGFDGVYLDIIDVFEYYETSRPTAVADMIGFVVALSDYAKSKKPGFL